MSTEILTNDIEDRYQLQTYAKLPIAIERGQGCYVYDAKGTKYLDLYGGHAVVSTGHCHPRVVAELNRQASQLLFYSNATYSSARARAVEKLVKAAGDPYHQVFLANSGSEANENAIKLTRSVTDRLQIISLRGSFHGRTYGALSSVGIESYRKNLSTPVPHHRVVAAEEAAGAVSDQTAAVLVEPIQSMGGVIEIPLETLFSIQQACREAGALLIFDEIQTGVGRTGQFLYSRKIGLEPDVVTLAKGIASGLPASAVLLTEPVASRIGIGDLGSTFGGGPLACAAISATLDVIEEEGLAGNAGLVGSWLKDQLADLSNVATVRGQGLLIGVEVRGKSAAQVQTALMARSILAGTSHDPQILRLMPPLTLSREEAGHFVEILAQI